ncbi:MAG: hypothetical protein QOJ12_3347 [Thermoleophilales bacterium]|jgi:hypothetical protein|nr:hypothetical protein [Thermoleophilales bacterium]
MQVKRSISKRIRHAAKGINVVADVNADVSVNVAEGPPKRPSTKARTSRTTDERRSK